MVMAPLMMLIPWFLGMAFFRVYPIFLSFWYSLTNFPLLGERTFIGLDNFRQIFLNDTTFHASAIATLRYVFFGTPMVLAAALFIAFVLNFKLKGVNIFRTAYYVPSILGGNVAVSILWVQMFRNNGLINSAINNFNNATPEFANIPIVFWLTSETWAPFTLMLLSAWQFGSVMLIFLAALQNVSPSLYEAASIDGAKGWRQFRSITLPIITPVVLFNAVNVLLRHFQEFNSAFLVTSGGPNQSTLFFSLYIYDMAFQRLQMGYASALTWISLAAIGVFTLILFFSSKYWVHYND
ncbi:MAG: sugar ABC transporter permease [Defluviitaleaceae bacterium]|nr:sugar ABC transporter permease [Defluviitaleaceae bacterium]